MTVILGALTSEWLLVIHTYPSFDLHLCASHRSWDLQHPAMTGRVREDREFLYTDLVRNEQAQSAHLTLLDEADPWAGG